jgi:hypothetical protein
MEMQVQYVGKTAQCHSEKLPCGFCSIENFCVVHDKHDRVTWPGIAYTIYKHGNSKDVLRCIICDCM